MELRAPRERVSPKARLMWIAGDLLRAVVVLAFLLLTSGPWNWWDIPGWVLVVVALVLLGYAAVVPQWRYTVHRWEGTETAVYTQTGWGGRGGRVAPESRGENRDPPRGGVSR